MAFPNLSEKITKIQEYNKNILLTAFSIFSLFSIITILEKEYSNIIWYLLNLEKFLLIIFTILVIFVILINIINKKNKLSTLCYLFLLSLSQYIVLLTKNIKFYSLEKESILKRVFEITFSFEDYNNIYILVFFIIFMSLFLLIPYLKIIKKENLGLDSNDFKKFLSIIVISIILSLIIDIKNAIIEDNEKKLKTNNNQVQYEKLQNVIK